MNSSVEILVTGGAGYVGSHTVVDLITNNLKVVVVDNLINAFQDEGALLPESLNRVQQITGKTIPFYNVNLLDKEALEMVFKKHKFSCVIHFAALKAVGESVQLPLTYYRNNITGSCNLFELMSKYGVKSLVFSSSATVYGNPDFLPITEDHPTGQCTNPYGKSKYFIEEMLKDLCISDKAWHVISLRYFNPVGAHCSGRIGEDPKGIPNNLMPYISQVAVGRREYLTIFGNDYDTQDGTGVRDYIHIEDLASGHVAALRHLGDKDGFRAYNLGTGKGVSVLEMVEAFRQATGAAIPTKIESRRAGDIAACYADTRLAETELGWKAKRDLSDMCRDTWNWQSKNPNGFASS